MYIGVIQAMWSDIRPKEHGRTRQKTSSTEVREKLQKAGVYLVEGYVTVVDPGGNSSSVCSHFARDATRRGLNTVSSGGIPTIESPHTSIDVSSKRPRPGCVITSTGEKENVVDEDDSLCQMICRIWDRNATCAQEQCLTYHARRGLRYSRIFRRNSPAPYKCVFV